MMVTPLRSLYTDGGNTSGGNKVAIRNGEKSGWSKMLSSDYLTKTCYFGGGYGKDRDISGIINCPAMDDPATFTVFGSLHYCYRYNTAQQYNFGYKDTYKK